MTEQTPHGVYHLGGAEVYATHAPEAFNWRYIEQPAFDRNLGAEYSSAVAVLDAGCGQGRTIEHLISRGVDPSRITGIDSSEELLKKARLKLPGVKFVDGALESAEVLPGSFDLITCNMVLDCMDPEQLRRSLDNFYSWLKPGGTLFHMNTHPWRSVADNPASYTAQGWRETVSPWGATIPYYHRTVGDLINQTVQAGFKVITLDEAAVVEEAKEIDLAKYTRYKEHGASRLAIKAIKS